MSNSRSSGYPLVNVTKNGVDGVISLNCLVDSWVRWSLIPNLLIIFLVLIIFISPLINVLLLSRDGNGYKTRGHWFHKLVPARK
jgi:hypothetical protein